MAQLHNQPLNHIECISNRLNFHISIKEKRKIIPTRHDIPSHETVDINAHDINCYSDVNAHDALLQNTTHADYFYNKFVTKIKFSIEIKFESFIGNGYSKRKLIN